MEVDWSRTWELSATLTDPRIRTRELRFSPSQPDLLAPTTDPRSQQTYPSSPGRGPVLVAEEPGSVGVESSVDERVDAGVGASVQEQELLDAVVDLVVGVRSYPEPENKVDAVSKATLVS